jgi:anti-sigma factor RsiW
MNCNQSKKVFIFQIEGCLPAQQSQELNEHLSYCPSCKALYNKLQYTMDLMPAEKHGMTNPYFLERVEQKLANLDPADHRKPPAFVRILKPAMLAVLIVISVFIGVIVGGLNQNEEAVSNTSDATITQIAGQYQLNANHQDALENYYASK